MRLHHLACILALAVAGAWSRAAAPLIHIDEVAERPEVRETGRLLEIRTGTINNRENTPAGALAAAVAVNDVLYEWTPSPDEGRVTGGADLIDAAQSPDESLLVLLEKIGGAKGPNSTRVLCFNLANDKLVKGFALSERKLTRAAFVPGSSRLVAAEKGQPEFESSDRLVTVELRTGKVSGESQTFDSAITSVAANFDNTFVTLENGDRFHVIAHNAFSATPRSVRTLVPNAKLMLSQDGNTLILFGEGRMEKYNVSGNIPELLDTMELPEGFKPEFGTMLGDDTKSLVLVQPSGSAQLLAGGIFRELASKSGETLCYHPGDRKLMLAVEPNEAVNLYTLPARTEPEMSVSPGKLKPFNKNGNFRLFNRTGAGEPEAVLIDHRGNVCLLTVKPRRWIKKEIYLVPKE